MVDRRPMRSGIALALALAFVVSGGAGAQAAQAPVAQQTPAMASYCLLLGPDWQESFDDDVAGRMAPQPPRPGVTQEAAVPRGA